MTNDMFTRCVHALVGGGVAHKAQFAEMFDVQTNSVRNMMRGTSRVPPGLAEDIRRELLTRQAEIAELLSTTE